MTSYSDDDTSILSDISSESEQNFEHLQRRLNLSPLHNEKSMHSTVVSLRGKSNTPIVIAHNYTLVNANPMSMYTISVHSEAAACDKLPERTTKKLQKVDICNIRVNTRGQPRMSKPCKHCLIVLNKGFAMKGYRVKNVTYSHPPNENNETFTTVRLADLLCEENPHVCSGMKRD